MQKLRKIGRAVGVVIPAEVLARHGLAAGAQVEFEDRGAGGIVLRPVGPGPLLRPEVAEWYEGFKARYRDGLQRLGH